jgi:tetratricopeptide (TPR) repeat protein
MNRCDNPPMHMGKSLGSTLATALLFAAPLAAQFGGPPLPESARPAQALIREGKLDQALAIYKKALADAPDSLALHAAMGNLLDLMGQSSEAHAQFARAIELATTPDAKAPQQRAMAMSYAFAGDCRNTVKYEQMVVAYWATHEKDDPANAFYQEGEMADEAARVCIDNGDLDAAAKWYQAGRDYGLKQPHITPVLADLWEFRWEHAQARIAARHGDKTEAQQHVARAQAILAKDDQLAHGSGRGENQAQFMPYLTGYVALYTGDYKTALEDLQKASPNDPFYQCLLGQAYEKLGEKDKAMECYRKAAATTAHNPPAAFARPFARKKLGD